MNDTTSKPFHHRILSYTLKGLAALLVLLVVLTAGVALTLRNDPSSLKIVMERVASNFLNRELQIGTLVELEVGTDTYLLARNVTLANPDWAQERYFLSVEQVLIRMNIPSIWRDGPVLIDRLELTNARLDLVELAQFPPNWEFWPEETAAQAIQPDLAELDKGEGLLPFMISHGRIIDSVISYRDPDQDIVIAIDSMDIQEPEQDALLVINAKAIVNDIPFTATGHIGPGSAFFTQKDLRLDLLVNWGELTIDGRGNIDDLANLSGANLHLEITAPHSRPLLDLLGMPEVRDGPLFIEAQISDANPGVRINLDGTLEEFDLHLSGKIADPLEFDGVDMNFVLDGPSLIEFGAMIDLHGLPDLAYEFTGEFYLEGSMLRIRKGQLTAGEGHLTIDGILPNFPGIDDWQVTFEGGGINMALIGPIIGVKDLPVVPYNFRGDLNATADGVELIEVHFVNPISRLALSGLVGEAPLYLGSSIALEFTSNDLSETGLWLGFHQLPALAFSLDGNLSYSEFGWTLENGNFSMADLRLTISGVSDSLLKPTKLSANVQISSPDLAAVFNDYGFDFETLPHFPVTLNGRITGLPDNLTIEHATIKSGESSVSVSGFLGNLADLESLDLKVGLKTPDLLPFFSDTDNDLLPPLPVEVSGKVMMSTTGLIVKDVNGQLAGAEITLSGLLNPSSPHDNSRITLAAKGENLGKVLTPWFNQEILSAPYQLSLDASYNSGSLTVERLEAEVTGNHLSARFSIDDPQQPANVHGYLQLSGDSSQSLFQLSGQTAHLTDSEYLLKVDFHNTPELMRLDPISLDWGKSDYSGSVAIESGEIPTIHVDLHSQRLNLPFLLPDLQQLEEEEASEAESAEPFDESMIFEELTQQELAERVIPDEPLNLDWIRHVDATFKYEADEIYVREDAISSAVVDFSIADGVLTSRQISWDGTFSEGTAELSIRVLESGNEFNAYFDVQRLPLILLLGGDPEYKPGSFYRARFKSTGNSLLEVALNADGALVFSAGGGSIDNHGLDLILGDVLGEIITRLNPFRATDDHTQIICHAGGMTIKDGKIRVSPRLVVRSNKMDILTSGTLDLDGELLNMVFTTRARKGIGISASKAVTPYFKIGGTIANPRLVLDKKGAAVSGTATAVTGGLSIIAEGLWDRWIATARDPCKRLFTKASKKDKAAYSHLLD